jgi:hypothetical protein
VSKTYFCGHSYRPLKVRNLNSQRRKARDVPAGTDREQKPHYVNSHYDPAVRLRRVSLTNLHKLIG